LAVNQSFADFLSGRRADTDTVLQAARYYLAERTGDLSPREMCQALAQAAADPAAVDPVLHRLEQDSGLLEDACLALLSSAWEDSAEVQRVRNAVEQAKEKLPIVEVGILAIVAMYGMYLLTTGGVKRSETVVKRTPDGGLEERKLTEFFGPAGPLSEVAKVLRGGGSASGAE
jgi:hypothetical protein